MSRGSFSRTVARAAASGGGRAYKARRPMAWYMSIFLLCVVGIGLIAYSRYERTHSAAAAATTTVHPGAKDNWHLAFAIDICGKVQAALPQNTNLTTTGIRTYGDGLINVVPGAVSDPKKFEGAKATLATFAADYSGFKLTSKSVEVPGTKKVWANGAHCSASATTPAGKGILVAKRWTSTSSAGKLVSGAPGDIKLTNGSMITLAFVPRGATIPVPPSKATLVQTLGLASTASSSTTSTTAGSKK